MGLFTKKDSGAHQWRGVIEEYRHRLPVSAKTPIVSLREGGTPLIYACNLSELLGNNVWIKYEGLNPTGSFKDRGMTMAISKAAEDGAKAVICASTGNTSASAAAYAVKAGMRPAVLIPKGKIAMGKLAQAVIHDSTILQVNGNFDDCLTLAKELSENYPVALVNSVNPYRIEGLGKNLDLVHYISADLSDERGVLLEYTVVQVTNFLLSNNFELVEFSPDRFIFLFHNKKYLS